MHKYVHTEKNAKTQRFCIHALKTVQKSRVEQWALLTLKEWHIGDAAEVAQRRCSLTS